MKKNILFMGFGDIASRCARRFDDCLIYGVSRSQKDVDAHVQMLCAQAGDQAVSDLLASTKMDVVVLTLTPKARNDEAYQYAYVEQLQRLLTAIESVSHKPELIIFVSSTSVYGQDKGEWVDETSETLPSGFSGKRMLEAEQILQAFEVPSVILRFTGIYGPGRKHLIKMVEQGKGGSDAYTNRIHAEDCAGVIEHLIRRHWQGGHVDDLYLASDDEPVKSNVIRRWIATKMGLDPNALNFDEVSSLNKRCSNRRLRASGYEFLYPTYKTSYGQIIDAHLSSNKTDKK